MLDRVAHDEWLVDLAKSKGANYLTGARVDSVNEETVCLRDGREFTARIVGAGGHNDPLRRSHWDESSLKIPIKFVLMDGEFGDAVELHFGSMAPGGYAWMFPKQGGANIGVGIQNKFAKGRSLNLYAEDFIQRYGEAVTFAGAGSLPMSGTIDCFVKETIFLSEMPLVWFFHQMVQALPSQWLVAELLVNRSFLHLENGPPLDEYEKEWKRQMGSVMRNSKLSFKVGSWIMRLPDWILNLAFNPLTENLCLALCDLQENHSLFF